MTPVLVVVGDPRWFPPFGVDLGRHIVAMEPMEGLGLLCWVDETEPPPPPATPEATFWARHAAAEDDRRMFREALRAGSWSVSA